MTFNDCECYQRYQGEPRCCQSKNMMIVMNAVLTSLVINVDDVYIKKKKPNSFFTQKKNREKFAKKLQIVWIIKCIIFLYI